jgi:hypothetical protein
VFGRRSAGAARSLLMFAELTSSLMQFAYKPIHPRRKTIVKNQHWASAASRRELRDQPGVHPLDG